MSPTEFCGQYIDPLDDELCPNWWRLKRHYVQTSIAVGLDPSKADLALTMFPD